MTKMEKKKKEVKDEKGGRDEIKCSMKEVKKTNNNWILK